MDLRQLDLNFEATKLNADLLARETNAANVIDLQARRAQLDKDHQDELIASILDSIRHLKQK